MWFEFLTWLTRFRDPLRGLTHHILQAFFHLSVERRVAANIADVEMVCGAPHWDLLSSLERAQRLGDDLTSTRQINPGLSKG